MEAIQQKCKLDRETLNKVRFVTFITGGSSPAEREVRTQTAVPRRKCSVSRRCRQTKDEFFNQKSKIINQK